MSRKQLIFHPTHHHHDGGSISSHGGRQPLLRQSHSSVSSVTTASSRFAEVAGGTTAECAAVACCCPCGLADLAVLVVYRVPAGLCKRAIRQRRRHRLIKKGLLPLPSSRSSFSSCIGDDDFSLGDVGRCPAEWKMMRTRSSSDVEEMMVSDGFGLFGGDVEVEEGEFLELEKEMWDHFYSGGFWRKSTEKPEGLID